jgi:hypothetical protein
MEEEESTMGYSVYYGGEVAITPPLTPEHTFIVRGVANLERNEKTAPIFAAIAASRDPMLPYHAGLFDVSEDGTTIVPEEEESHQGIFLWLCLLLEHFFRPSGYVLNGEISWNGEEPSDRGSIFIKDNLLEIVDDVFFNPGPSWSPLRFADSDLKQSIQELVDSADGAGCSQDLTVVSAKPLEALRGVLAQI